MMNFCKDFIAESKRVIWPSQKELINMTAKVIIISTIVALIILSMDYALSYAMIFLQELL